MSRYLFVLINLLWIGLLHGQFVFNGSARRVDTAGCYQLTGTNNFESGSIWHTERIDLRQSFQVVAEVFLGCLDGDGADGLVFGFQPVSTSIGQAGEGIGFQGVTPSIGLEMDTYQNFNLNDPEYDHIALIANGNLDHRQSLAGPVALMPDSANAEDCRYHHLQVTWDATTFNLKVYFDCRLIIDHTQDFIRTIFNQPEVFWGFTAATGGAVNIHGICLKYTTFLNDVPDYVICPGMHVPLNADVAGPFRWNPSTGFTRPDALDQLVQPQVDITYRLVFEGPCDTFVIDTVHIDVLDTPPNLPWPDTVMICPDSVIQLGFRFADARYHWSTGDTSAQIRVTEPGTYQLSLSRRDTFCETNTTIDVLSGAVLEPDLRIDTTLCAGDVLIIDVFDASVQRFLWNDGVNGAQRTINTAGLFAIRLENSCTKRLVQISTTVDDCGLIYFPNVFSPNQDGINDVYRISADEALFVESFAVFDRWGNLVFVQKHLPLREVFWDGTFMDGNPVSPGVYVYQTEIEISAGINKIFRGDVTVIR